MDGAGTPTLGRGNGALEGAGAISGGYGVLQGELYPGIDSGRRAHGSEGAAVGETAQDTHVRGRESDFKTEVEACRDENMARVNADIEEAEGRAMTWVPDIAGPILERGRLALEDYERWMNGLNEGL